MVIQALQKVFRKPTYVIISLIVSVLVFMFAVWLPNIQLIMSVAGSSDISLFGKLELLYSLLGAISTNFTLLSATYTIVISILFGLYISTTIYFLKNRIREISQSGIATGFLGIVSGVLGIGCGACGAFLLTSFLSLVGAGGILVFLPLGGGEFGIIGATLLIMAIYKTVQKIESPMVCNIEN